MTDLEWIHGQICQTYSPEALDRITDAIAVDIKSGQFPEPYAAELLRSAIRRQRAAIQSRLTAELQSATTDEPTPVSPG